MLKQIMTNVGKVYQFRDRITQNRTSPKFGISVNITKED